MAIHLFYFYKVGVNMIEFKNVTKIYDDSGVKALDDIFGTKMLLTLVQE